MNDANKKKTEDTSLSFSDALARTVLNSLSAHIAILDQTGIILETNNAWRSYSTKSGMPEDYDYLKINYLEVCDATRDKDDAVDARKVAEGIRAVINGDIDEFLYDYPCHSENSRHWYYMRAIRMSGNEPVRVVVSHEDITALKLTEEALNQSRSTRRVRTSLGTLSSNMMEVSPSMSRLKKALSSGFHTWSSLPMNAA